MNLCGCAVLNKIICLQVFTSEEMKNNVVSFRNTSRFCSSLMLNCQVDTSMFRVYTHH